VFDAPPNVAVLPELPKMTFPVPFKVTCEPVAKLIVLVRVIPPPDPAGSRACRLKIGALGVTPGIVLVMPPLMRIIPVVAVAIKLPVELRVISPEIAIAFAAVVLAAVIVILPNPDVVIGEVELVENDPEAC